MATTIYCLVGILTASVIWLNVSGRTSDDNALEEFTEQAIEEVMGVDIDLSPSSNED